MTIRFIGELSETLVFHRKAIEDSNPDLMAENGIPRRVSGAIMKVWNSKPARSQ